MYPYIVWSAAVEALEFVDNSNDPRAYFGGRYLFDEMIAIGLLGVLAVLQFFWAYLLLKVVWKAVQGGHAEDNRSDDEDDDPAEDTAARKKD